MNTSRRTQKRTAVKAGRPVFGVSKSRIRAEDAAKVERIFASLLRDAEATCAILIETTGALLAKMGDAGTLQLHTISSLLAAELAVAQHVAKHFGGEFTLMLHQARRGNIQITMAGKTRLLGVLFGSDAILSNVINAARRAAGQLESVLPRTAPRMPSPPPEKPSRSGKTTRMVFGREFVDAAKSRIDELLK